MGTVDWRWSMRRKFMYLSNKVVVKMIDSLKADSGGRPGTERINSQALPV